MSLWKWYLYVQLEYDINASIVIIFFSNSNTFGFRQGAWVGQCVQCPTNSIPINNGSQCQCTGGTYGSIYYGPDAAPIPGPSYWSGGCSPCPANSHAVNGAACFCNSGYQPTAGINEITNDNQGCKWLGCPSTSNQIGTACVCNSTSTGNLTWYSGPWYVTYICIY